MANKDQQGFDIRFPVAFGSGLASALLFVSALRQGSLPGLILTGLSPLPIIIATLGFSQGTGLGAAGAGAVTMMALVAAAAGPVLAPKVLLTASIYGAIFALVLTLPSWWLARLAGSGQSKIISPFLTRLFRPSGDRETNALKAETPGRAPYPFGDILLSVAVIAFGIVTAITLALVLKEPSYEVGLAKAVAKLEPLIIEMLGPRELPKNIDLAVLSRFVVETMPATASGLIVFALTANLWLGGRVVQLSHRLAYPWPDIPHDFRLPRIMAPIFVICLGLAFLHGLAGVIASIAASALGVLFVLQGLAVMHDLSRGMKFRSALLTGLYLALALLLPWPLVILAIIGLVEAGFSLRDRKAAPPPSGHLKT